MTIGGRNSLDNEASPVIVSPTNSDLDTGPLTEEQLINESPVSSDFDFSDEVCFYCNTDIHVHNLLILFVS